MEQKWKSSVPRMMLQIKTFSFLRFHKMKLPEPRTPPTRRLINREEERAAERSPQNEA